MIFGRCCSRIGEQGQGDQRVRNAKNYATSLRLRGHVAPFCFLRTHRATRSLTAEVAGGFSHCGVQKGNKKEDRKSTRLNSSHITISYAVFCLKKKKKKQKAKEYK